MLATGEQVLPVWEDLDLSGIVARWIPAWELISARPQHNPVHLYTVDRHSIQTVAEVQRGPDPGRATRPVAAGLPVPRHRQGR